MLVEREVKQVKIIESSDEEVVKESFRIESSPFEMFSLAPIACCTLCHKVR